MDLLDKLKKNGVPLRDYAGSEPLYGIKTGLNDAFLITRAQHDQLTASDPELDVHIRPYLRGQDIRRWTSPDAELFMILMKSSGDHPWPWANAANEQEAEAIFKKTHPALHTHFKGFEEFKDSKSKKVRGLRHRDDQGRWWWELRPCAYYHSFTLPKINIQRIAFHSRFSIDENAHFVNDSAVILPAFPHVLTGVLNQPIAWYYQFKKFPHKKDEAVAMDIVALSEFPIPPLGNNESRLVELVSEVSTLPKFVSQHVDALQNWLHFEFGLDTAKNQLTKLLDLDTDSFVVGVKKFLPRSRKLSSTEITRLVQERATTIEPLRLANSKIFAIERKLSDLVNEAYGLTPEEVQLMWETAPPRMPYTQEGLAPLDENVASDDDSDNEDDD